MQALWAPAWPAPSSRRVPLWWPLRARPPARPGCRLSWAACLAQQRAACTCLWQTMAASGAPQSWLHSYGRRLRAGGWTTACPSLEVRAGGGGCSGDVSLPDGCFYSRVCLLLAPPAPCRAGMAPRGTTLTQTTPEALQVAVGSRVAPHIWLARELVPLLAEAPTSSYTLVTGMLGEASSSGTGSCLGGRHGWLCRPSADGGAQPALPDQPAPCPNAHPCVHRRPRRSAPGPTPP